MAKDDIFQYRDCQCLQSVVVMYFNLIISEVSVIDINESLVMEVQKSRQEGYIQYYLSDHCIDILGHSAVVAATMLY